MTLPRLQLEDLKTPNRPTISSFRYETLGPMWPKPDSFDFLRFTFYWGTSRKKNRVIKRRTSSKRFRRSLQGMNEWFRENRHLPVVLQAKKLKSKLYGYYNYFGIRWNSNRVSTYRHEILRLWRKWLSRRSQKGLILWDDFKEKQTC